MDSTAPPASVVMIRPAVAGPRLQVEASLSSETVRPGEELALQFRILNPADEAQGFDVWADAYDAEGQPVAGNPVFPPRALELDAALGLEGRGASLLPAEVEPGGPYTLCLRVGSYGVETVDESCAEFTVIP
jgi:hypothetical protein